MIELSQNFAIQFQTMLTIWARNYELSWPMARVHMQGQLKNQTQIILNMAMRMDGEGLANFRTIQQDYNTGYTAFGRPTPHTYHSTYDEDLTKMFHRVKGEPAKHTIFADHLDYARPEMRWLLAFFLMSVEDYNHQPILTVSLHHKVMAEMNSAFDPVFAPGRDLHPDFLMQMQRLGALWYGTQIMPDQWIQDYISGRFASKMGALAREIGQAFDGRDTMRSFGAITQFWCDAYGQETDESFLNHVAAIADHKITSDMKLHTGFLRQDDQHDNHFIRIIAAAVTAYLQHAKQSSLAPERGYIRDQLGQELARNDIADPNIDQAAQIEAQGRAYTHRNGKGAILRCLDGGLATPKR